MQLYNIKTDPAETQNVYAGNMDVVRDMTNLMISYIKNGRSTPGIPQKNDGPENWGSQLIETWLADLDVLQ